MGAGRSTARHRQGQLGPLAALLERAASRIHLQEALRSKAATTYHVPKDEIALDEVTVQFTAEVAGTIRKWEASAMAGQIFFTNK